MGWVVSDTTRLRCSSNVYTLVPQDNFVILSAWHSICSSIGVYRTFLIDQWQKKAFCHLKVRWWLKAGLTMVADTYWTWEPAARDYEHWLTLTTFENAKDKVKTIWFRRRVVTLYLLSRYFIYTLTYTRICATTVVRFALLEMTSVVLMFRPSRLNSTQHAQSMCWGFRLYQLLRDLNLDGHE